MDVAPDESEDKCREGRVSDEDYDDQDTRQRRTVDDSSSM